jgi:MerR-like DNA binding protein
MNTLQLAKRTGVSPSSITQWVRDGWLRPAVPGIGRGAWHTFNEDNVRQVRAIVEIREVFGDSPMARRLLAERVPAVREHHTAIGIPEFALALA